MKAISNGVTLAESDTTVYLEGNHYFPAESVRDGVLSPTRLRTLCYWKGIARYYDVAAGGTTSRHGAWIYARPYPWAKRIKGHVAFAPGVDIQS